MYVELEVIRQLKKHDEHAFAIVYDNYYRLLYFIIASYVKNSEDVQDILQTVFLTIFNKIHHLRNEKDFHQWASKIARNAALDFLRKQKKVLSFCEEDLNHMYSSSPEQIIFNTYLTDLENRIFTLKVVYELTFQEISDIVNLKIGKIFLIYNTALEKVKSHYQEEKL